MARATKKKKKRSSTKKETPPKWLPDDWIMEVGVADDGKNFKCYLSPVSGYKFCSKKDVLHHLTTMKNDSHTSEMQSTGDNRQIVGSQVKSSQEQLPPGWILENRVYKSGGKAGQKYKSYYDPSSGSRFYSKADVFRFLGSRKLHTPTPEHKRCSHTMDNVLSQVEYSPDGLPPGWIKEIIVRKSSSNGRTIRKDPYYTDPDHEYVFRSLKDAIHYVATGEVSKHAVSQGRRKLTSEMSSLEEDASFTTSRVKELNSLGATIRRCLVTAEVETSNADMATGDDDSSKKIQLPLEGHASSELEGHASSESIEKGDSIELTERKKERRGKEVEPSAENMSENSKHVEKRKGKLFTLPSRASKRLAECEPDSVAEPVIHRSSCSGKADPIYSSPDTEHGKRKTEYNKGKQKVATLPSRASKRLAGCEPDSVAELIIHRSSCAGKVDPIYSSPDTEHGKRKMEYNRGKEMDLAAENTLGTSKHVNKRKHKVVTLPIRASKRLAGCEPDPIAKSIIACSSNNLTSRGGNEEQVDDTVPIIEERVPIVDPKGDSFSLDRVLHPAEQIVTEKKTDDRPASPLAFPFLDAWGDPCIEFAVKTLLGEIPVLEIPEFVGNQMSAVPTSDPTASATVEVGHQSRAELSKPSGLPEELKNQHSHVDGKEEPFPLEHGCRRVGQK